MARPSVYDPRPQDDLMPVAPTVAFPVRRHTAEVTPLLVPSDVPQDVLGYASDLARQINRLAEDGVLRVEVDGTGEHARLVLLQPVQEITWKVIE